MPDPLVRKKSNLTKGKITAFEERSVKLIDAPIPINAPLPLGRLNPLISNDPFA